LSEFERVREKLRAVVDTNVFVAGIFWLGAARECLVRFARREFEAVVSETILRGVCRDGVGVENRGGTPAKSGAIVDDREFLAILKRRQRVRHPS
jgi:hypothetical protein